MRRPFVLVAGIGVVLLLGFGGWALLNPDSVDGPVELPRRIVPAVPIETVLVDTVGPTRSLGRLLVRWGVVAAELPSIARAAGSDLTTVPSGTAVTLSRAGTQASAVLRVRYLAAPTERVTLERKGGGWIGHRERITWQRAVIRVTAGVDTAGRVVFDSAAGGPLPGKAVQNDLLWRLADIYAWQVDLVRDLVTSDRIVTLVEIDRSSDGDELLHTVDAAEIVAGPLRLSAYRFEPAPGRAEYYSGRAEALRRRFRKAPLMYRQISSSFSLARFHPILGIWRAHRGTDYAAPAGTPVVAATDGVVAIADTVADYGLLVEVDHGAGIATRYGHLSAVAAGIHRGVRVAEGQVIGAVGQSGLATAPHLHYEYRLNGVPQDQREFNFDAGAPIGPRYYHAFILERDRLRTLLRPGS